MEAGGKYFGFRYGSGSDLSETGYAGAYPEKEKVFLTYADTWTLDTWDESVLCIVRAYEEDKLIGLFNFSEHDKTAWINEDDGLYKDLISGVTMEAKGVNIPAYGYLYLKKL